MPTSDFNPAVLLSAAKWAAVVYLCVHVFTAFGVSLLAAKLRHSGGWLAWVPLLNHFLMCRVAGAPLLLGLLTFIPGVHLFVFAYLGAAMARRAGHSGIIGAAFGVPVFGAFVPLILATGPVPASALPADAPPARPPLQTALLNLGGFAAVLGLAAGGLMLASRMTRAEVPTVAQAAAVLPARVAGTMKEFPIDSGEAQPAQPTRVVTQGFDAATTGEKNAGGAIAGNQLPPWLKPEQLPAVAESATAAEYVTPGAAARVNVVTLALRDDSGVLKPPTRQQLAQLSPEATVTGVELQSAESGTYRGYRVQSPSTSYYAVQREGTRNAIIISAADTAAKVVADRLARKIGNGQGLLEYDEYRGSFGQLPAAQPGMVLQRMQTFTQTDIAMLTARIEHSASTESSADPQVAQMLPLLRTLAPTSCSIAAYSDGGRTNVFFAGVAGYASSSNAWMAMQALRTAQAMIPGGLPISVSPIDVGDASGFAVDVSEGGEPGGAIILRRGASIAVLAGSGTTSSGLLSWAENYVQGR